jgi:hypothetical protein
MTPAAVLTAAASALRPVGIPGLNVVAAAILILWNVTVSID